MVSNAAPAITHIYLRNRTEYRFFNCAPFTLRMAISGLRWRMSNKDSPNNPIAETIIVIVANYVNTVATRRSSSYRA